MAPVLARSLSRLPRDAIIDLALQWLQENRTSAPYLLCNRTGFEADEEDYLHVPAESVEKLRRVYDHLRNNPTQATKRDVIDRIVDGDWRRGLSLHQHATLDFAYLEQNDTALKWSALKLVSLREVETRISIGDDESQPKKRRKLAHDSSITYPDVSAEAFLSALKAEISPLVKAHFHLHRMPAPYNLTVLRLYINPNSAFAQTRSTVPRRAKQATDVGRIMYIALPDSCPYVYISISGSSSPSNSRSQAGPRARDAKAKAMAKVDMAAMKRIVLEAIPKALSRPQQRWSLESTRLVAKSLKTMCELRGNQKPGTGGGAYSFFAESKQSSDKSPVDVKMARDEAAQHEDARARQIEMRFGHMNATHYSALDRIHIKLTNIFPPDPADEEDEEDASRISTERGASGEIFLTFSGSDVFNGLKKLAQLSPDHVDLGRMPAWMTGELGVSTLTA